MRRGRSIALIALFVLAGYDFGLRPIRLVQSFKALRCCTEHCKKSGNMGEAERCCGVAHDQAGLRAVHTAAAPDAVATMPILPGGVVLPAPRSVEHGVLHDVEPPRGPPLVLLKQSFLI